MPLPFHATQPAGWTDRVLGQGRGLLLVDGLDEIPERDREHTRRWLRELLDAYPGNQWLVTSRPSAVREDWLAPDGFTELVLSPMTGDDVAAFIRRWHAAARHPDASDTDRLDGYERSLLDAVRTKPDLGRLATNPLMCGLICALHRDRRGYLPHGRKELYDAALSMLLSRRDGSATCAAGGNRPPSGTEDPAAAEAGALDARQRPVGKDRTPPSRRSAATSGHSGRGAAGRAGGDLPTSAQPNRSIARAHPGSVDFVHRTFQDYLSARAVVERHDFDFLIDHAHLDDSEEVIRMSVALARPDECGYLLEGLLAARKDARPVMPAIANSSAAACLDTRRSWTPRCVPGCIAIPAIWYPTSLEAARALAGSGLSCWKCCPIPSGVSDEEAIGWPSPHLEPTTAPSTIWSGWDCAPGRAGRSSRPPGGDMTPIVTPRKSWPSR